MKAEIGSVSSGTMRREDLVPCFLGVLEDLADGATDLTSAITSRIEFADNDENYYDYYESDVSGFDLEELSDALAEYAPKNCYFGAHCGDGADYGFWPFEDLA